MDLHCHKKNLFEKCRIHVKCPCCDKWITIDKDVLVEMSKEIYCYKCATIYTVVSMTDTVKTLKINVVKTGKEESK